ncbi:hypothetical protein TPHA_0O01940 [Tetrapisispora phaffii CBS 4417]|uniref:J domain-containing protein n=1 Tax=Tetrapisispora phaffii (strain ATCC 24235 / CBS 4417 / NBRC 1672 / NRRL Y-8282 / UCD 70-5) TaxID=1071381 RepID=G8C1Y2_TETPH|nr:hypothetical protein TPHA_0O01940 [Tetrapisispora phaffii CBS 4417]CCE66160.1 hypothetical protein TPHA_0O01940 [Tetrapisispora phaffii CBS 4417]
MKTCYYELLDVEMTASDADLKKAYRRKALQYHPDKNINNIKEATDIFANIRTAYEILSDPQERVWYDSHKNQILNDEPIMEDGSYEVDSRVTGVTTEELMMFFNSSLYTRFDDSPAGVFQIAGKIFSRLAKDEIVNGRKLGLPKFDKYVDDHFEEDINTLGYKSACDKYIKEENDTQLFPVFGYSTTEYEHLKSFYKKWNSFNTLKTFSWKDEYMYSQTYDRRTKREISKINEKARKEARTEYNRTVIRFVGFMKKLDKRMKEGAKEATKKKVEMDKLKRQQQREQYLKEKKSQKTEFTEQTWQEVNDDYWKELEKNFDEFEESDVFTKEEDNTNQTEKDDKQDEVVVYECIICQKLFKSEKQLNNHTQTNLHKKNMKEIRRELKNDSLELGLDEVSDIDDFSSANEDPAETGISASMDMDKINEELEAIQKQLEDLDAITDDEFGDNDETNGNFDIEVSDVEIDNDSLNDDRKSTVEEFLEKEEDIKDIDEDIMRDEQLNKLLASLQSSKNNPDDSDSDANWGSSKGKKNNKKNKNNKINRVNVPRLSANNKKSNTIVFTDVCSTCGEAFESRNLLFKHVKTSNHALAPNKVKKKNK